MSLPLQFRPVAAATPHAGHRVWRLQPPGPRARARLSFRVHARPQCARIRAVAAAVRTTPPAATRTTARPVSDSALSAARFPRSVSAAAAAIAVPSAVAIVVALATIPASRRRSTAETRPTTTQARTARHHHCSTGEDLCATDAVVHGLVNVRRRVLLCQACSQRSRTTAEGTSRHSS
jgi:hypothetical protein